MNTAHCRRLQTKSVPPKRYAGIFGRRSVPGCQTHSEWTPVFPNRHTVPMNRKLVSAPRFGRASPGRCRARWHVAGLYGDRLPDIGFGCYIRQHAFSRYTQPKRRFMLALCGVMNQEERSRLVSPPGMTGRPRMIPCPVAYQRRVHIVPPQYYSQAINPALALFRACQPLTLTRRDRPCFGSSTAPALVRCVPHRHGEGLALTASEKRARKVGSCARFPHIRAVVSGGA